MKVCRMMLLFVGALILVPYPLWAGEQLKMKEDTPIKGYKDMELKTKEHKIKKDKTKQSKLKDPEDTPMVEHKGMELKAKEHKVKKDKTKQSKLKDPKVREYKASQKEYKAN